MYGYMGKAYGIPDDVLYLAAGYAQLSAGTSRIDFIVSNFDDITTWTTQDNKWFVQIADGKSLNISAYNFEGYEFIYWLVVKDDGQPLTQNEIFNMVFTEGDYIKIFEPAGRANLHRNLLRAPVYEKTHTRRETFGIVCGGINL